jgi:cystathionine beta-lyase
VDPLDRLLQRRSAKWRTYPRDVLPLPVAEMDFALAPAVSAALRGAVERSDTGYAMAVPVHFPEELEALVRLARIYRVVLISDEIHAPLVLPGCAFTPLLTVPGAAELAVSVVSASKAWNLAGLKCAAVVTASPVTASIVDRFPPDARWRIGHLGVIAAVAAYNEGEGWLDQLLRTLDHRRSVLGELLSERLPSVRWQPPEATFLAWLDCGAIGPDDEARELFLQRGKVALEPGLRFGAPGAGHVRLNFATSVGILDEATRRMRRAVGG